MLTGDKRWIEESNKIGFKRGCTWIPSLIVRNQVSTKFNYLNLW